MRDYEVSHSRKVEIAQRELARGHEARQQQRTCEGCGAPATQWTGTRQRDAFVYIATCARCTGQVFPQGAVGARTGSLAGARHRRATAATTTAATAAQHAQLAAAEASLRRAR